MGSVVNIIGGESIMMYLLAYCDFNVFTKFLIFSEPTNSAGFEAMEPEGKTDNFGVPVLTIRFMGLSLPIK